MLLFIPGTPFANDVAIENAQGVGSLQILPKGWVFLLHNWLGEIALDYISEVRFRLILQLVLTALGLRLIWMAVPELGWF